MANRSVLVHQSQITAPECLPAYLSWPRFMYARAQGRASISISRCSRLPSPCWATFQQTTLFRGKRHSAWATAIQILCLTRLVIEERDAPPSRDDRYFRQLAKLDGVWPKLVEMDHSQGHRGILGRGQLRAVCCGLEDCSGGSHVVVGHNNIPSHRVPLSS